MLTRNATAKGGFCSFMKFLPSKPLYTPKRLHYGWVIIFITALAYFFSAPGQTYFISGFTDIYVNELKLDRSSVSSLYSLATLIAGLVIFSVGKFSDRFGNKRTTLFVALFLGAACIWNSFNTSLITVFIGFFLDRFFGAGAITFLPTLLLPSWFYRKRAFAFSLMSMGGVLASSTVPLLNAWLLSTIGWQAVWRVWGLGLLAVFLPAVYFFLFDQPRDIGQTPDFSGGILGADSSVVKDSSFTPREALRTFPFWGMTLCQTVLPLIGTGLAFHLVSIYASKGLPPQYAALSLSLVALVSFPVTLLAGRVLDRFRQHHVAALISLLELGALIFMFFARSAALAILFSLAHGCAMGIQSVSSGIVWPDYFGMKHLGTIRGYAMAGLFIGSAFGPLPLGILYGLQQSYDTALLLLMVLPVIAFILALFSKKPYRKERILP